MGPSWAAEPGPGQLGLYPTTLVPTWQPWADSYSSSLGYPWEHRRKAQNSGGLLAPAWLQLGSYLPTLLGCGEGVIATVSTD